MRHIQLDNLDDRRELMVLLGKLPPRERVEFVNKAAASVQRGPTRTLVSRKTRRLAMEAARSDDADSRLTLDLYFDLWMLAMQHGLDLERTAKSLESLVSGGRTP